MPLKKGLSQKVLDELDAGAEQLKLRHRPCQCFLDFAVDLEKLKVYHDEMEDAGNWFESWFRFLYMLISLLKLIE